MVTADPSYVPDVHPLYKELVPPSTVTGCIEARLTGSTDVNLVVSKGNLLQIYLVANESCQTDNYDIAVVPRLSLVHECRLFGTIESMGAISKDLTGVQYLILAFNDAKVSILEWDGSLGYLETVSLHYYEIEELKKYTSISERHPPVLRIDPQNRCAVLWYIGTHLAVLPFDKETAKEMAFRGPTRQKGVFGQSRTLALKDIHASIHHVLDVIFLNGYIEPTIAILYEPKQTWTGRLADHRDSCAILVVSLSLTLTNRTAQTYPVIFHAQNLPYNCERLVACPSATGGLLVMSPNALIYLDYTNTPGVVLVVNAYYGVEESFRSKEGSTTRSPLYDESRITDYRHLKQSLEHAQVIFLNPDTALIVLRSGRTCLLKLFPSTDESVASGWSRRKPGVARFSLEVLSYQLCSPASSESCVRLLYDTFADQRLFSSSSANARTSQDAPVLMFIGSAQNNSQLVELVWSKELAVVESAVRESASAVDDWTLDADDLLLYGNTAQDNAMAQDSDLAPAKVLRFKLRITDDLFSTGSLRSVIVAHPVYDAPEDDEKQFTRANNLQDLNLELEMVGCSGDEDSGTGNLVLLQKSVRFSIDSSFPLESGATRIWTFQSTGKAFRECDDLCLISTEQKTLVFEAGESELNQVNFGDFAVDERTIEAGQLSTGICVQVCPLTIVLVDMVERQRLRTVPLRQLLESVRKSSVASKPSEIVAAQVLENYIAVQLDNSSMLVYKVADKHKLELVYSSPSVLHFSLFSSEQTSARSFSFCAEEQEPADEDAVMEFDADDVANDDAFLYGSERQNISFSGHRTIQSLSTAVDRNGSLFAGIIRNDNSLEILDVNRGFCCVFSTDGVLADFPSVLLDSSSPHVDIWKRDIDVDLAGSTVTSIREFLLVNLGRSATEKTLYMLLRDQFDETILYKCIACGKSFIFSRQTIPDTTQAACVSESASTGIEKRFKVFRKLGDPLIPYYRSNKNAMFPSLPRCYEGVFVSGLRPKVLLVAVAVDDEQVLNGMRTENYYYPSISPDSSAVLPSVRKSSSHDYLRIHPCPSDGAIDCFSEFHTPFSPFGFIYLSARKKLRMARLPGHFDYTFSRPVCKRVFADRAIAKIAYHHTTGTYVALTTRLKPFVLATARHQAAVQAHTVEDDEPAPDAAAETANLEAANQFMPSRTEFLLELVSPRELELISTVSFGENEAVSAMGCVSLTTKATVSGYDLFVAVGTSSMRGEDLNCRGNTFIYSVISIVPEPDRPFACYRLKQLVSEDEKGPITALGAVNGYLVSAVGQKIIISAFEKQEKLEGIAFLDIGLYTTALGAVKGLIVVADIQNSVKFLGFQDDPPRLKLLGQDYQPLSCYSIEFVLKDASLMIAVADFDGTLTLLEYAPQDIDSELGQRLLKRSEFHVGSSVTSLTRLACLPPNFSSSKSFSVGSLGQFVLGGTTWGAVVAIAPLSAKTHSSMVLLTSRLAANLRPLAGLNPSAYRLVPVCRIQIIRKLSRISMKAAVLAKQGVSLPLAQSTAIRQQRSCSIVDGELISAFINLPKPLQLELAKALGFEILTVLEDIASVENSMNYF